MTSSTHVNYFVTFEFVIRTLHPIRRHYSTTRGCTLTMIGAGATAGYSMPNFEHMSITRVPRPRILGAVLNDDNLHFARRAVSNVRDIKGLGSTLTARSSNACTRGGYMPTKSTGRCDHIRSFRWNHHHRFSFTSHGMPMRKRF